jgi:3-hydroxyisobutyrate dehydrogenase
MGAPMCGHLLEAGHELTVTTRTRARAEPLLARGAAWAATPAQVASAADVVLTMVGSPADVRAVVLGDDGVLAGASPGSVLVDMTTSEPALATEIHERAASSGVGAVDAPVSGGDVGARRGTLSIMVGGEHDDVERVRPLLEILGDTIVHQGGPGAGQHTKMVNQILIGGLLLGLSEGLLYGHIAGLDLDRVLRSVAGGAAGSWSLDNYGPRILSGDFAPGFAVEHFVKDLGIALDEATRMALAVPGSALARQMYVALAAQGDGGSGVHALVLALARLSGRDWREAAPGA